jgi:hyperosmotically inducible periplasmic protein
MTRKRLLNILRSVLASLLVNTPLLAQAAPPAARYDSQIQAKVTQKLAAKSQYRDVKSSVEDGIVTLNGTVDLYQHKLNAAKLARKVADVQGVRNLISIAGPNISDEQIAQQLAKKLTYVRVGYDNTFDYFALGVKDGTVTVAGDDRTGLGRDEALADIYSQPGVKDVISQIAVEPASIFDDGLPARTARAIYRDPVLSKYAIDPAHPIRIVVINGHVKLYGVVDSAMEKNVAGICAGQTFGAFSVENKLEVRGTSDQPGL